MASVLFLFYASFNNLKHGSEGVPFWGKAMWHCTLIHIFLSLAILSKAYYSKLFGLETMNVFGEVTVLFGVLAMYCFWLIPRERSNLIRLGTLEVLSRIFIATHLVGMGIGDGLRWINGMVAYHPFPGYVLFFQY